MADLEWLLREATDERAIKMSQHTVVDDATWRASIERLDVAAGLVVMLTDTTAHRDMTLKASETLNAERWVGSQVTLEGETEMDFLDGKRTRLSIDHALLFRLAGPSAAYTLTAGMRYASVGYTLEIERVRQLFDGEVPSALRSLVDPPDGTSRVVGMHGDGRMRSMARNLGAKDLNGPLRVLMVEGAVLQLLALQAAAAGLRPLPPSGDLSARERDAVHEARRLLLADMRRPPSLGELATAVGLTEKRLNAGFRQAFEATVFEVLRDERLAHAQIALLEQNVSLKEIAFRVGYNHVSNFVRAFTARYGAPPRQYLHRGTMADDPGSKVDSEVCSG